MRGGARGNLESIKSDYRALGYEGPGGVLLSPSGEGKGVRRMGLILHVNNWLHSWSQKQDFGFYDRGTLFENQWLLGIHTTKWGKIIFSSGMADLA